MSSEKKDDEVTQDTIEDLKAIESSESDIDPVKEKKLLWKCDYHVVPILNILFMFAFLDRINIGNARLMGLEKDLGMSGHQYNVALFVFFIPYILLEVPSNIMLKKMRPSWWLSGIIFCWGIHGCFLATRSSC
jgi:hypothetical protein